MSEYHNCRYEERRDKGLCVRCGKLAATERKLCSQHLRENREAAKRSYARRKDELKLKRAGIIS